MDHAPAIKPVTAKLPPASYGGVCAECCVAFRTPQPGAMFCGEAHRKAFQDRLRVRGRAIAPLAIAVRMTRGGTRGDIEIGIYARRRHDALIQKWIEEDRAANPPRMPMNQYLRRIRAKGHDQQ